MRADGSNRMKNAVQSHHHWEDDSAEPSTSDAHSCAKQPLGSNPSVQLHRLTSRGGTMLVVKPGSTRVRWQRKQDMGVCRRMWLPVPPVAGAKSPIRVRRQHRRMRDEEDTVGKALSRRNPAGGDASLCCGCPKGESCRRLGRTTTEGDVSLTSKETGTMVGGGRERRAAHTCLMSVGAHIHTSKPLV